MAEYTQSRRTFLTVASTGVAAASVGIAGGCASGDAGEQSTGLNVSSIGEGDAVVTGDNSTVVVMRDSSGVYAMSLVCKHLGAPSAAPPARSVAVRLNASATAAPTTGWAATPVAPLNRLWTTSR